MGKIKIAVLVSGKGRGSNMAALVEACRDGRIEGEVVLVIGTRKDMPALERAQSLGVPVEVIDPKKCAGEEEYGQLLLASLEHAGVDLICLAGYMRLLPLNVVRHYRRRILNVHPALLPEFGGQGMYGQRVHEAVLASGVKETGCTVHFVDEQYDTGPILLQTKIPIEPGDTPETLVARLLPVEHETYIQAVQMLAKGRG
jgi:phosphoribosylglycinamide formyltransferase-1